MMSGLFSGNRTNKMSDIYIIRWSTSLVTNNPFLLVLVYWFVLFGKPVGFF